MPEFVTLVGIPELKKALIEKAELLRSSAARAVAAEAALVAEDARHEAPYLDGDDPDGHLREDIAMEAAGTEATVQVANRHAAFQEYGTTHNAPHPFMHPAAEKSRGRFPKGAAAVIRTAIGG